MLMLWLITRLSASCKDPLDNWRNSREKPASYIVAGRLGLRVARNCVCVLMFGSGHSESSGLALGLHDDKMMEPALLSMARLHPFLITVPDNCAGRDK